jgi:hypothetical protein
VGGLSGPPGTGDVSANLRSSAIRRWLVCGRLHPRLRPASGVGPRGALCPAPRGSVIDNLTTLGRVMTDMAAAATGEQEMR